MWIDIDSETKVSKIVSTHAICFSEVLTSGNIEVVPLYFLWAGYPNEGQDWSGSTAGEPTFEVVTTPRSTPQRVYDLLKSIHV